jgi:hypothetical protein
VTTIKQYAKNLRDTQYDIALKMGVDISRSDITTRVILLSGYVNQAIVLKTLVDAGVITDAALKATMDSVRTAVYTMEPGQPTGWDDITPVTGV